MKITVFENRYKSPLIDFFDFSDYQDNDSRNKNIDSSKTAPLHARRCYFTPLMNTWTLCFGRIVNFDFKEIQYLLHF